MATLLLGYGSVLNCRFFVPITITSQDYFQKISIMLPNFKKLHYPLNSLLGAISDKIVNLTNLAILDLAFNHFGGKLTPNLGELSKLKFMTLDFNNLEGPLPQSLMNCTNLVEWRLGSNDLEGDISMLDFSRLTQLTKLDLRMNNFTATIDLSKNNIVGDTRTDIGQLQLLYMLVLDSNNFSNIIPDQISNLKSLKVLKLSMNHLSGIMPSSLASLNFLKEFKASYNNLKGPIPTGTQLQSFNASAFEGNPDFCGAPLPNKCGPSRCIDADNKNNKDVNNY
ncbi:receptor-like protein 2 [Prunus persica]|uniref:receptor-like protein 2 n=1 Tax=Prunus persica TaxID=3760 RepID=UPI0009AB5C9B|nr:receptor-like protein 2 [Prunus persica]